jgi:EAL domain-containing protein (putative c-di-GMP-specific phosphodiesterase class I)
MRVVAEGVDSAEGLGVVSELGCEMAQGFFIGRPMRGDLVPEWLDRYLANATASRRMPVTKLWLTSAEA